MATSPETSPYYPPRARWYSPLLAWSYRVRRWLYLDQFRRIGMDDLARSGLGLVLPGWGMLWSARPIWGVILGTAYVVAVPIFILWRGRTISNLALMTMMSIHAGGVLRKGESETFLRRIALSMAVFFTLAALVYTPLINLMERRWFVALKVDGRVVYVRTGRKTGNIRRGEWIAYKLEDLGLHHWTENGIVVQNGFTLGRVLGVMGDEMRFTPTNVVAGGQEFALRPYMPTNGVVRVEEGTWFVWPEMSVANEGIIGTEAISATMMRLAKVQKTSYVGIAPEQWLWRRQTLP